MDIFNMSPRRHWDTKIGNKDSRKIYFLQFVRISRSIKLIKNPRNAASNSHHSALNLIQ